MGQESIPLSQVERFNRLCKPLKDLALNWEVDIAEELSEYLEAIQNISDSENLNYAQIAMIIQGSANVYSKKVDFLHKLVYKSLNFLVNSSSSGHNSKTKSKRNKDRVNPLTARINGFGRLSDVIKQKKPGQREQEVYNDTSIVGNDIMPDILQIGRNSLHLLEFASHNTGAFDIPGVSNDNEENINEEEGFAYIPKIWNDKFSLELEEIGLSQQSPLGKLPNQRNLNYSPLGAPLNFDDSYSDNDMNEDIDMASIEDIQQEPDTVPDVFSDLLSRDINEAPSYACKPYKRIKNSKLKFERRYRRISETQSLQGEEITFLYRYCQKLPKSKVEPFRMKLRKGYIFERKFLYPFYKDVCKINQHFTKSRISSNHHTLQEEESDDESIDMRDLEEDMSESEEEDTNVDKKKIEKIDIDIDGDEEMPQTYLEVVKLHVKKYLARAHEWAKSSNIEKIVKEWQTNLTPILEEQASHPEFDIHEYGSRILSQAKRNEGQTSFRQVANSLTEKKYETCRMFLATLQLANNEKIELHHESNYSKLNIKLKEETGR